MKDIMHLIKVKDSIECNVRSGAHFRHAFMGNYSKNFNSLPNIESNIEEDGWVGCIIKDSDGEEIVVSSCEGMPIVISDIYSMLVEVKNLSFEYKHYLVPDYDGEKVFAFTTAEGNLRGKINNTYFLNSSILNELQVEDAIKALCLEYNCIVFGSIVDRRFIATEIMDKGNNSVYTKEITDQIFEAYGLDYERTIEPLRINSILDEYGAIIAKIYREGKIFKFIKKSGQNKPKLHSEIYELLFANMTSVVMLDTQGIYGFLNRKGRYYQYDKELVMQIIGDWQNKLRKSSAEELFQLINKI